jgi:hypothetical protein
MLYALLTSASEGEWSVPLHWVGPTSSTDVTVESNWVVGPVACHFIDCVTYMTWPLFSEEQKLKAYGNKVLKKIDESVREKTQKRTEKITKTGKQRKQNVYY